MGDQEDHQSSETQMKRKKREEKEREKLKKKIHKEIRAKEKNLKKNMPEASRSSGGDCHELSGQDDKLQREEDFGQNSLSKRPALGPLPPLSHDARLNHMAGALKLSQFVGDTLQGKADPGVGATPLRAPILCS